MALRRAVTEEGVQHPEPDRVISGTGGYRAIDQRSIDIGCDKMFVTNTKKRIIKLHV